MRGYTHLIVGAAIAAPFVSYAHAPALLAAGALAGLLPDVDHSGSTVGRWVPWPAVVREVRPGLVKHGRHWFGGRVVWHRGEVHSFGAGVIATMVVTTLAWFLDLGWWLPTGWLVPVVFLAWCSHLAADCINRSPIMLWWPLNRRMVRIWRGLPEGSLLETLAEIATALGAVWLALPEVHVLLRQTALH